MSCVGIIQLLPIAVSTALRHNSLCCAIAPTPSPLLSYPVLQVGGHHMDLFFSNPLDTPSVKLVREKELEYIRKWIQQHDARLQERAEL